MMEKRHRCKLCFRNFANGRALGGHMKSHMMNLHQEQEKQNNKYVDDHKSDLQETNEFQSVDHSYSSSPSSSSSFASDDDDEEEQDEAEGLDKSSSYKLRENPRKTALFSADHDFSSDVVEEEDTESGAESPKESRVLTRSKRKKLTANDDFLLPENETSSSISDTSTEEHVAHCLMMLSRDTWTREDIVEHNNLRGEDDDPFEDSGSAQKVMLKCNNNSNKVRGRYRCETCNKLFKSYQALGGHRASHKKIRPAKPVMERARPGTADAGEKLHKCPFCERVFTSGQALGGHKRTHSMNGGGNNNNGDSSMIGIDLNLPAPIDEDDHEIISKISNSDENYF